MNSKADSNRGAFTLFEIIIAMSLVSILMVLVWSLFSTYSRLAERSTRTATEMQLVRSVSRQLRSDLQHFAVLPHPPNIVPAGSSGGEGENEEQSGESIDENED